MHRCLQLAVLGAGNVAPNPMVGAVLVHDDTIIGEGYHMRFGDAHAEVNCLNNVAKHNQHLIKDSTLYVSLEPCTHFGKTPPCTDLVIRHGIKNVVIGCADPYEKVNGSGIEKLITAGIQVTTCMEAEAKEINKRFFTFHKSQRPYIILKWAQSNNNKISKNGVERTYITNDVTNTLVHKWRSEEGAIMAGTNTLLSDNPSLTTRSWPGRSPLRMVIDKHLRLPATAAILQDGLPLIILNMVKQEETGNTLYHKFNENENILAVTLNLLRERNITSLIVEGGAALLQSFIQAGVWDEARVITNRMMHIAYGLDAPELQKAILRNKYNIHSDEIQVFERDI